MKIWFPFASGPNKTRIITTRRRKLLSVTDLIGSFSAGQGPATSSEFINTLAELLTDYIEETVEGIEDQTSDSGRTGVDFP